MTTSVLSLVFLLLGLSSTGSQQLMAAPGIKVTPDRDQAVPFASDDNVTYTCEVDGGRTAVWEVSRRQIVSQEQARVFAESGIFVEGLDTNTSVIYISAEARRNASRSNPPEIRLLCVAAEMLKGTEGRRYSVFTYDPPIPPLELTLDLVSSTPNPALILIWDRPINIDQRIDVVYTVEINSTVEGGVNYGPFVNLTDTFFPVDFPEALHSNKSCQMYEFFVTAHNGAGSSDPVRYLETLPITTDVTNISQSLAVNSVDVRNGQGLAFVVSFKTLQSCSDNFPILNYTLRVDNISTEYTIPNSSLPQPGLPFSMKINDSVFPELVLDTVYSIRVNACSEFSCKMSNPQTLYTSDLQSLNVVILFERNIFISCTFANNSLAAGCSVRLPLLGSNDTTSGDVFELRRPRPFRPDDVMITQCNVSTNQRMTYDDIVGVAVREDGTLGEVVLVAMETEADDEGSYTQDTGCTLPQQATGGGSNVLAIILPIVIVLALVLVAALTLTFALVYFKQRRRHKSRPTIETEHDDDEDCVTCEVKFKTDEFSQLLKRSASAPVTITAATKSPQSSESSSQTDNVFFNIGQVPSPSKGQRPPYGRSVSENYQVEGSPYELELSKRSIKVKLHRQGLKQYAAAKRSMSEGGSGTLYSGGGGSGGDYPRVSSRLKISDDLHNLLNLDTLLEESEPTSPAGDEVDGERHSLIVPRLDDGVSKRSSASPSSVRSGVSYRSNQDKVTGL